MPRVARGRIGRRTSNASHVYNFRRRNNVVPEQQVLNQRNNRALVDRSAFDYNPDIDYLNFAAVQIGEMICICSHCNAKKCYVKGL